MGSQTPTKSGLPLLIDSDISNTVDFHVASTEFLDVIDKYANYVAVTYVWNYTNHTSDPITNQAKFFRAMNDGTLHLAGNDAGGVDSKIGDKEQAYMSKLDSLLEKTEVWVRTETGFPETRQNPETGATEYHAYDLAAMKDVYKKYDYNTNEDTLAKIQKLELKWGMENFANDKEFLLYWMKKYRRSHETVKAAYKKLLADNKVPESKNWFSDISDSIGLLHRRIDTPDTSTIPMVDIDFELLGDTPATVDPVIGDKLDDNTKLLMIEFSRRTNTLFRNNRVLLIRAVASPKSSHGEVGVNDHMHSQRMRRHKGNCSKHVNEILGHVHNALGYIQTAANEQKIDNCVFDMVVEDSIIRVDLLKNKYHTLASALTSRSSNDDVFKPN